MADKNKDTMPEGMEPENVEPEGQAPENAGSEDTRSEGKGKKRKIYTYNYGRVMTRKGLPDKPITQTEFIKEVSKHTGIRPGIVKIVFSGIVDVMVEQLVNNGRFRIVSVIDIRPRDMRTAIGANYTKISPKMSQTVKKLFKRKTLFPSAIIDRNNWREISKDIEINGVDGLKQSISDKMFKMSHNPNLSRDLTPEEIKTIKETHRGEEWHKRYDPLIERTTKGRDKYWEERRKKEVVEPETSFERDEVLKQEKDSDESPSLSNPFLDEDDE